MMTVGLSLRLFAKTLSTEMTYESLLVDAILVLPAVYVPFRIRVKIQE